MSEREPEQLDLETAIAETVEGFDGWAGVFAPENADQPGPTFLGPPPDPRAVDKSDPGRRGKRVNRG